MNIKTGMNGCSLPTYKRTVEKCGNRIRERIELKNADGTTAGSISITRSIKKKSKKLQYNFKEISARIMQAKTSGNASRVLTSARAKAAMLKRKLKSGEYDDKELQSAIMHAEAIARVAKKRMKHLQEEEKVKRQGGPCEAELEEKRENGESDQSVAGENTDGAEKVDQEELQRLMREYRRLMREAEKLLEDSVEEAGGMEELSEEISGVAADDMDPADYELMKKKHRAKELREIMEADMKYLKAMFDKLAKEKQENASGSAGSFSSGETTGTYNGGVALELGGADIPVQIPTVDAAALAEGGVVDTMV